MKNLSFCVSFSVLGNGDKECPGRHFDFCYHEKVFVWVCWPNTENKHNVDEWEPIEYYRIKQKGKLD